MKKLMTVIAAVGMAFGLFADEPALPYGTSFEGEGLAGKSITEVATEGALWTLPQGATATVTEYGTYPKVTQDARPGQWVSEDQYNYLNVKTTLGQPVVRALDAAYTLSNKSFFFDSLVEFTHFEDAPTITTANGEKIAVWVQEIEDETTGAITTNLMVTAGNAISGVSQENYLVYPNFVAKQGKADWARVTIKAIPSVVKSGTIPGFVVWVDGDPVSSDAAKADIDALKLNLTDAAKIYNDDAQLFLSMNQGGEASTISAIAYDGTGKIDDIDLTETAPSFAADPTFFTVEAGDANVLSFTYNDDTYTLPHVFKYEAGKTYTLTANYAPSYIDGDWKLEGASVTPGSFTPTAPNQTGVIASQAAFVTVTYKVGGVDGSVSAADIASALAKLPAGATDVKATLAQDVTTDAEVTAGEITIDLNGNDYTYTGEGTAITATALTVLDSSTEGETTDETGAIVATDETAVGIINASTLVIENGKFNGSIEGSAGAIGGWYTIDPDEALNIVANGYKSQLLAEQTPYEYEIVEIKNFTVTVPAAVNGSIVSVVADTVDLGNTNGVYTIAEGAAVTVTYAPDEHYVLDTGSLENTIDELTKDETITAPTFKLQQFTLTIPEVANATAVVSNDTKEVATRTFDYGTKITVYWTAATGWKITSGASEPITMLKDETAAAPVVEKAEDPTPSWVPEGEKEAYNTWKAGPGATASDFTGTEAEIAKKMEDSFLLNCAPTENALKTAKDNFKITSITKDTSGNWVVLTADKEDGEKYGNGLIKLEAFENVGCTGTPVKPGTQEQLFWKASLVHPTAN